MYRKFTFSCDTFGGFSYKLNINDFESIDEIIATMISKLHNQLYLLNLEGLINTLERLTPKYHIHDYKFGDILLLDQTFYICNHNCNINLV